MDDSLSSEVLSESTEMFCNSPTADSTIMDCVTYESLVSSTKLSFHNLRKEMKKTTFSIYFSNLLENCYSCITQSLDLIVGFLSETHVKINKLIEYMTDAASILQMLSDSIKSLIESVSMSCTTMKTLPMVTGQIVMLVFTHCKDSESLYGDQLMIVEKYIKDLFRTCHELQQTYLTVLEKHYIFNITEKEEQDILIEALDINLKIGEIVQSLDVKTMAEQWKAYTTICAKYSNSLMDTNIYCDCTNILCAMVSDNIRTALQENQEEKVILRSLKVTNFTLKIFLRMCITFKAAVVKDYDSIMDLLLYINLNNEAYLQTIGGKSSQFINVFNNNVLSPVNALLGELLYDNRLLQCICDYDIHKIRRDDKLLGLILLVISTIKSLLQKGGDQLAKLKKHRLINVIYTFLPYCHVWFNMGLTYKDEASTRHFVTYGLFEHLLTYTVTLASMMIIEEVNILEQRMLEALLGTDYMSAMFTSNLWMLLARMSNRQLLFDQVVSLSKIYQNLENNPSFVNSPQKVHLGHTIERLFKVMTNDDKKRIYKMFNISDERNISLWNCLKIRNLPDEVQCYAVEISREQFQTLMRRLTSHEHVEMDSVIKSIILSSTYSHTNQYDELDYLLIEAWVKACPNNMKHIVKQLHSGNLWLYKYIEALVLLMASMEHIFYENSVYLVKVLHIISEIIQDGCAELILLLTDILCKLASLETIDVNRHVLDNMLTQSLSELFENTDSIVKYKLYFTLRQYEHKKLYRIVSNVVDKDESLKEAWNNFIKHGVLKKNSTITLKEQLQYTMNFEYCHKCIEQDDDLKDSGSVCLQKSLSNNFDLIDMDSLFEPDSNTEPACKKAKLNVDEVEGIISRLEKDATLLCNIKENVFTSEYKSRVKTVCDMLEKLKD